MLEVESDRNMMASAKEIIVLADHTKFGNIAMMRVAPIERVRRIITDSGTAGAVVAACEEQGVEVEVVSTESSAGCRPAVPGGDEMVKVTLIGAGSAVFARQIVTDVLAIDGLDGGTFALVDIDADRLELAHDISEKLVGATGKDWTVESSTERNDVLAGTDFLVNSIEVAGLENVRHDYEIPAVRGRPVHRGHHRPRRHLQGASYGACVAGDSARRGTRVPGCHGNELHEPDVAPHPRGDKGHEHGRGRALPQHTGHLEQLAGYLEVPPEELCWRAAGINHNSWFVELARDGEDLYPELRERARTSRVYEHDPVRFETMLHLGAFPSESSGHFSEYCPISANGPT